MFGELSLVDFPDCWEAFSKLPLSNPVNVCFYPRYQWIVCGGGWGWVWGSDVTTCVATFTLVTRGAARTWVGDVWLAPDIVRPAASMPISHNINLCGR